MKFQINQIYFTSLCTAINSYNVEIVKLLLSHEKIDPNIQRILKIFFYS